MHPGHAARRAASLAAAVALTFAAAGPSGRSVGGAPTVCPAALEDSWDSEQLLRVPLRRHRGRRPPADEDGAPLIGSGPDDAGLVLLQTSSHRHRAAAAAAASSAAPRVDVYGQIRVGTPPKLFTVAIDTGSSNLLLVADSCRSAGCQSHQAYSAEESQTSARVSLASTLGANAVGQEATIALEISTGSAEGQPVMDRVCLGPEGDVCTDSAFLQMTQMSTEGLAAFPYDGILGVGLPGGSLNKSFDFLGALAGAGHLPRLRFSVWLALEGDGEDSEITFGGFDAARVGSELLWVPVVQAEDDHSTLWQAKIEDLAVGNVRARLCGPQGCRVAFDTGTSAIAGPPALIDAVLAGLSVREDCSNYQDLPLLGFDFGLYILNLEKEDYVKVVDGRCYHQFLRLESPALAPPPLGAAQPLLLLGDPFLKRWLTVYDREALKVGLALAKHSTGTGAGRSMTDQISRLMHRSEVHSQDV